MFQYRRLLGVGSIGLVSALVCIEFA